ncbi:protein SMG9-like [Teleopsis dalmanni]|uniref:protein SMG9-like n=1 Tax=Teleopsis dalmanni TaxID=139649 RepID=UPI0018CE1736|nr:protein SMG9-like [Teleopsis dalmanni]
MYDKRRRYRNKNKNGDSRLRNSENEIQPKILLKAKLENYEAEVTSNMDVASQIPQKTIIVTRTEASQSPLFNRTSPNITKELSDRVQTIFSKPVESLPQMTRPTTVISSTGQINTNVKKILMSTNTDFLVIGVIGTQGVGKSTVMNFLANENPDYDYYNKMFVEEGNIFPTKVKSNKYSGRCRTESTHMFITSDRMILIDSPPLMCNSYKKDMVSNELDDLCQIISFLSVCHLVIVVQDNYLNINFLRLLQFAAEMKPKQENPPFLSDYFPNIMFFINRANRFDFAINQKKRVDNTLKLFFKKSKMRVYLGQTSNQQHLKKSRASEADHIINSFLFPNLKGSEVSTFHNSLVDIVENFRSLVNMTPRNKMQTGTMEFTEELWFEMLCVITQKKQHASINAYNDVHRKHFDFCNLNTSNTSNGSSNNQIKNEVES